ncbi:MAG: hypothetical protein B7733_19390 [Myxococcales bacterium FL481]|nr:MAG: hypothetical protein B7733_19390 [Myxococcales bacterium FL481]
MGRSIILLTSLSALALVGAALFLLVGRDDGRVSGEDRVRTATRSPSETDKSAPSSPRPTATAVAKRAEPVTTPARAKPPRVTPRPTTPVIARSASKGRVAEDAPLTVDPKWSAVLKSSVSGCQEVIAMLDGHVAAGEELAPREQQRVVGAAVDNLDMFRDYIDANDPTQVETLAQARAQLARRLSALGLELPAESGRITPG